MSYDKAPSIRAGIINGTFTSRSVVHNASALDKSTFIVRVGEDNVSLNPADFVNLTNQLTNYIDMDSPDLVVAKVRYVSIFLKGKAFTLTRPQLVLLMNLLEAYGSGDRHPLDDLANTNLVVTNATMVTALSNNLLTATVAPFLTAADIMSAVDSEVGAAITLAMYADDAGNWGAPKTGTDATVTGDYLVVTAENGTNTATYVITVDEP